MISAVQQNYAVTFMELLKVPYQHPELIWAIVPLYFAWFLNEVTSSKASFRTALQTGFSFLWAGAHWTYLYFHRSKTAPKLNLDTLLAVNVLVTVLVLMIGLIAFWSGIRHKYPRYCSFLGHARFSNYFMITIFPIQSNYLPWTWERLIAILLFAFPIWIVLHFGLMPIRKR